jgi:hypothetical protein
VAARRPAAGWPVKGSVDLCDRRLQGLQLILAFR